MSESQTSEPRRAGIIGWPVTHSRSPLIHNGWIEQLGLSARYDRCPISPEADFRGALEAMMRVGFVGANVTIPHKQAAFASVDRLDATAAKLGAVNTLCFEDGEIVGSNTDGAGFVAALHEQSQDWHNRPVLVLGAGGATRAILVALAEAGVGEIRLANRTRSRAEPLLALLEDTATTGTLIDWQDRDEAMDGCGLLVNTTSLGMGVEAGEALDMGITLERLAAGAVVTDIVYTPLNTALLTAARDAGFVAVDGLGMLMHQAALSFEQWFGVAPPVDAALRSRLMEDLGEA